MHVKIMNEQLFLSLLHAKLAGSADRALARWSYVACLCNKAKSAEKH